MFSDPVVRDQPFAGRRRGSGFGLDVDHGTIVRLRSLIISKVGRKVKE